MMRRLSPVYLLAPVFLACMICGGSLAQEPIQPNTIFFEANRFYKSEQYPQAIEAYEELVAAGILSGHLFYNLGNAYIKTGTIGKAILNYERALQHLPRDADIKSNLEYARSLVEGETITERHNWFLSRVFFLVHYLNLDELTAAVSLLYICLMAILTLGILFRGLRRSANYGIAVLGMLLLFSVVCFALRLHNTQFEQRAVITSEPAEARFEPADAATSHFTLREGMVIEVLETRLEWSKIERRDGKVGWLQNVTFEMLSLRGS